MIFFTVASSTVLKKNPLSWDNSSWSYLRLPAVALLSFLYIAVATLLAPVEHLDLGHVVQTHADAFLQTGGQVLLTARAENGWERVPVDR